MIKMDYKIGDIILYKSKATWTNFFTSKQLFAEFMIKLGTFNDYTHVGIILDVDYKKVVVGQALQNFNISNEYWYLQTLSKDNMIKVKRIPKLTNKQKALITQEGYFLEGKDYDWKGIFLIGLHLLTGKTLFKDNANKFFCSEAVDIILKNVGIKLFNKQSRNVTPADFEKSNKIKVI